MQHWPLRWGFLEGFGEEGALRGKCFERGRLVCAPTMYEGGQWEGKLNLLPAFIRLWRRGDGKMKRKISLQTKFHGKNFIYQYAVVSKLVERYFHCSWCQQVMLRSCRKKKWMAKWNKKQKLDSCDSNKGKRIQQVLLTHAHWKIILWLWTIAEINLQWGSCHERPASLC